MVNMRYDTEITNVVHRYVNTLITRSLARRSSEQSEERRRVVNMRYDTEITNVVHKINKREIFKSH